MDELAGLGLLKVITPKDESMPTHKYQSLVATLLHLSRSMLDQHWGLVSKS